MWTDKEGNTRPLTREKFYVPGSVLRVRVNVSNPLAWGLPEEVDVMFNASPTFRLLDGAQTYGVRRVAWFEAKQPLRSGWAWGQEYLQGGVAIAEAKVGIPYPVVVDPGGSSRVWHPTSCTRPRS